MKTDESSNASSPFRDREPLEDSLAIKFLIEGEIEVLGRMPWSSNATHRIRVLPFVRELNGSSTLSKTPVPICLLLSQVHLKEAN